MTDRIRSGIRRFLEEVMTPSDNELSYWEKRGLSSDYMYELAEEGWEEKLGIFETVTA